MIWYRELGFYNNPFSIKPAAFHSMVIGYDLSEVLGKIEKSKVLFIEGDCGYGKTTILKHMIRKFGGSKNVVYYNCNRTDNTIDVEILLKGRYGFFGRLFGGLPSEMIVLLDEVERLSQSDQKELLDFHKEGNIKSIVFFGPNFDKVGFCTEMRKQMVNNVIKLTELTDDEAVQMVKERFGTLKLLSDKIIKQVFRHSGKNPRLMLENLEDLCKYAVENNEEEVKEEHLKEVLGIALVQAPKKRKPIKRPRPKKVEKKAEKREEKEEEKQPLKSPEEKREKKERKEKEEVKITPRDEDFPPEDKGPEPKKKKPEPQFEEEESEPVEGDEESEYFYYY